MSTKIQMCIISSSSHLAVVITEEATEVENEPFAFHHLLNLFCLLKLNYSSITCVNNKFVAHQCTLFV